MLTLFFSTHRPWRAASARIIGGLLSSLLIAHPSWAATPTPSQLAQFKQLPKAQQEQLARQYGIDLNSLQSQSNTEAATSSAPESPKRIGGEQAAQPSMTEAEPETSKDNPALKPFGYAFLTGNPASLNAVDDLPLPADYQVGPGDTLDIQIFGKENQQYQLTVKRDGNIHFPKYGPMQVAGETFGKVREQIKAMFAERVIGVDVTVDIGAMRTMQVYLAGDVKQPGAYTVNGLTTITQALLASGGIKHSGSLRNIQLKRDGHVVALLDLYDLLLAGDSSDDVRLLKGDTLFVPARGAQVAVDGEVLRPALYELAGNSTLADVVDMAGGALPEGYLSSISVKRATESGTQQYNLDMTTAEGQRFAVKNGDDITIAKSNDAIDNAVVLRGEVVRQGAYSFEPGMKISDLITTAKRDLKPSADLNYALVVREVDAKRNIEVLQFELGRAIDAPTSADNLSLQQGDQVFVFNNGIDSQYWDKRQSAKVDKSRLNQKNSGGTYIDPETGAEVAVQTKQNESKLVKNLVEQNDEGGRSLREQELAPIIERLKDQASNQHAAPVVELTGAVKYPGIYPYPANASLAQLLDAAGGLTEAAYVKQAEISRREVVDGRLTVRHYPINLGETLAGKGPTFAVQRQDRINIKTKPNWHKNNTIELQGEVRFPGVYAFDVAKPLMMLLNARVALPSLLTPKGRYLAVSDLNAKKQSA
jgi:Periplasmic protein involved in polysaccharide export